MRMARGWSGWGRGGFRPFAVICPKGSVRKGFAQRRRERRGECASTLRSLRLCAIFIRCCVSTGCERKILPVDLRRGGSSTSAPRPKTDPSLAYNRASIRASNCWTGVTGGGAHPASSAAMRSNNRSLAAWTREPTRRFNCRVDALIVSPRPADPKSERPSYPKVLRHARSDHSLAALMRHAADSPEIPHPAPWPG